MEKGKELLIQALSKEFEEAWFKLEEKDIEFALFGYEMGLLANNIKGNGNKI